MRPTTGLPIDAALPDFFTRGFLGLVALRDFVFDAVDRLVGDVFDAPHSRLPIDAALPDFFTRGFLGLVALRPRAFDLLDVVKLPDDDDDDDLNLLKLTSSTLSPFSTTYLLPYCLFFFFCSGDNFALPVLTSTCSVSFLPVNLLVRVAL